MTQFVLNQSVAGAGSDFTGLLNAGLFSFSASRLPLNQGIICKQLGLFGSGVTANWLIAYFTPPAGQIGDRILAGASDSMALVGVDGNLAVTFCPGKVPRAANGDFWDLRVYSDGLTGPAAATLAFDTEGCCT